MPGPNPYLYKPQDTPLTVANQFGVTPNQLLAANPGGYPFSTGQAIQIPAANPYQYSAPIGPQPAPGPAGSPPAGYGPNAFAPAPQNRMVNDPKETRSAPATVGNFGFSPTAGMRNILYRLAQGEDVNMPEAQRTAVESFLTGGAPQPAFDPSQPGGGFAPAPADNSDYANTRAARYYAAAGTPFLQQRRWDPQARRYVSIGRLLRQGKLDLQGNWHKRSRRQVRNAAIERKQRNVQQAQDFTLANSLISFGAASG